MLKVLKIYKERKSSNCALTCDLFCLLEFLWICSRNIKRIDGKQATQ